MQSSSPLALEVTPIPPLADRRLLPQITVQPPILTVRRILLASTPLYLQTIGVQRLIGRTCGKWYGISSPGGSLGLGHHLIPEQLGFIF